MAQYTNYTVTQGDTLQLIAQKVLGDASLWTDIARFNKLKYPYITQDPQDKVTNKRVACVGDTIVIQDLSGDVSRVKTASSNTRVTSDYVDELLLGRDMKLVPTTGVKENSRTATLPLIDDFLELTTDNQGSLEMTKGVYNVVQAVTRRIMTEKGSLYLHPEYGSELHSYRGMGVTYELLRLIELDCQTTALQDGRVVSATAEATYDGQSTVNISMEIRISNSDTTASFIIGYDRFGNVTINNTPSTQTWEG